jgi:phosphoenolpyruvate synthase/pyruvate phosphate dikinase
MSRTAQEGTVSGVAPATDGPKSRPVKSLLRRLGSDHVQAIEAPRGVDPYILVARSTDPAWTPLFLTAGAIVVEEGGPLSHAAIIARELGLPAVLNVPGFLALLDGATTVTLRVDGDHGTVEILDDIPTSNPARGEVFAS